MVLCPPFGWAQKKGFNLDQPSANTSANTGRRDTYKFSVNGVDPAQTNGGIPDENTSAFLKYNSLSVVQGVPNKMSNSSLSIEQVTSKKSNSSLSLDHVNAVKKTSYMSVDSGKSSQTNKSISSIKDSDSDMIEDILPAARKTVSEIVRSNPEPRRQRRKPGIIAPPAHENLDIQLKVYAKDERSEIQIEKAIMANDFLKNLMDDDRLASVVEAMSPQEYQAGSLIIREGESGSHLYVSAYGQFEVLKGGQVIKTFGPGEAFGELAILYKAKRFASIRCIAEAKVWTLERRVFQKIMVRNVRQEQEDNVRFLRSVPLTHGIHDIELAKISEFLKREFFSAGTVIVRQGDRGDKFYIIRGGTVVVTKREHGKGEHCVGKLERGAYFGEQALLHEDRRLATVTALPPGVECLTLDRGSFTELLGNLDKLKNVVHTPPMQKKLEQEKKKLSQVKSEFEFVELKDLEIVGTMGVGGFGRVELVQFKPNPSLTFALKCLKKIDMVQQQQQEHAYNEKDIMLKCESQFICRLYRTFKDDRYIYFLMEPILGGDVWTILQKKRWFSEDAARFMAACVIEAFEYLHKRDIVYRDLKPENLMLDNQGYVKLVDFGFAKRISSNSKTWTFAGTPEYVAPEIVLNKGHDRAVDCWALGILIHEMLAGKPPFRASGGDHMKTYTLILRGIDAVTFHSRVSKSAQHLICRLCRAVPAERLGYLKNGIPDIKNHKWLLGFDWEGLRGRRLKAPLIQPVANSVDLSNFEKYPKDKLPPDETSGWDKEF